MQDNINPCKDCLVAAACNDEYGRSIKRIMEFIKETKNRNKLYSVSKNENTIINAVKNKEPVSFNHSQCMWTVIVDPITEEILSVINREELQE